MHIHFTCIRDCMISFNISDILYIYIFIYTVYLCGVHYLCLLFRPKKHRLLAAVELSSQLCTVHPFHGIMAVCLYDCTFLGLAKRV